MVEAYNMIWEELALVKQNGAWKPRRRKDDLAFFTLQIGKTFSFYFIFIFLFDLSWSEWVRVDPTRTGGPSWSGPTFVPAL